MTDGSSRAKVTGSLYGLLESGALWNEDMTNLFKSLGFNQSAYDSCVFFQKGIRIVLYVDDLYISYERDYDIKWLQVKLIGKFGGEFKFPIDNTIEFLGMKMKNVDKGVIITMPSKLDDVTEGIDGITETPAGMNLFDIEDESAELNEDERKKFHTLVAKLLYIAKRVRPDVLLAVNFLTTRVQKPTEQDWKKLIRVLKYLNGTKEKGLTLRIGKTIFVQAYIDASFGTHVKETLQLFQLSHRNKKL